MMTRSGLAVLAAVLVVVVSSGGVAAGVLATPTDTVATATDVPGGLAAHGDIQAENGVDCSYPIEVTDATGETVTVEEEPDRVVALAPSAAQVMWALEAQDKVVGMPVGYTTAYLNGLSNKTNVLNSKLQPITEEVINLEPDLVLAPHIIDNKTVQNFREKGLTVVRFEKAKSVDDVGAKTRLMGRLVGAYDTAANVSARTKATVERVREVTADGENPKVYYAMGGGYTAGADTFIGDVIDAAGGDNIASAADISEYGVINEEIVVSEDPEWIVTPGAPNLRKSASINSTTAVENDQIVSVDGNFMSQPGPRVTEPLLTLAGTFHPDSAGTISIDPGSVSVPQCQRDLTTDPTETTTEPDETDTDSEETTTDSSSNETITAEIPSPENGTSTESGSGFGPGFGVVATLMALIAGTLLVRRD